MKTNNSTRCKGTALKIAALTSTAIVGLAFATPAQAQAKWTGGTSTDWFDAANWNPAAVPTAIDDAIINTPASTPIITGPASNATANAITIGDTTDGSLSIQDGASLTTASGMLGNASGSNGVVNIGTVASGNQSAWSTVDGLTVGNLGSGTLNIGKAEVSANLIVVGSMAGSTGVITVNGPTSSLTSTTDLAIGDAGNGAVSVTNGGIITAGSQTFLAYSAGGTGTATIDGAGSTLNAGGVMWVGYNSSGNLTVSNGGVVKSGNGVIANSANGVSTATVTGPGSNWTNSIELSVGHVGTGSLKIANGGSVSAVVTHIGAGVGSNGSISVSGPGSELGAGNTMAVGEYGNGTLSVTNGAAVGDVQGLVGLYAGSQGKVDVDGAGSVWTGTGDLAIGAGGLGALSVTNGGTVNSQILYLGYGDTAVGTVTVSGAGSSINATSVGVGFNGTGTLNILNGGAVNNAGGPHLGVLGASLNSKGTARIDGAGSSWINYDSDFAAGASGTGILSVTNGGTLKNNIGYIGANADGTGSATIDGAGSSWINAATLYIGGSGAGVLSVTNGGVVSATVAVIGNMAGSNGAAMVSGPGSTLTLSDSLFIGSSGNGSLTIANGGSVTAPFGVVLGSTQDAVGILNIGAAANLQAAAAGTLNATSLEFGDGTGIINFNHTNVNYAFATRISGKGAINQYAGVTNMTGDSSLFTGGVNVIGGKLYVNNSLIGGQVVVNNGATLGGNGVVGSLTAKTGAIIAPGNSIGTLNVAGNASFATGSIYQVELNSAGLSDLIKVTGAATIANGALITLTKSDAGAYLLGKRYTVLTADGGLTGKFTLGSTQLTNFIGLVAGSDAKTFFVDVAKTKSFVSAALTPNQKATAAALDGMPMAAPLPLAVASLMSDASARGAYNQLSGEIYASSKKVLIEDSRFVRNASLDRLRLSFDGVAGDTTTTYIDGKPVITDATTDRFAIWGQGYGAWGRRSGDGNAATINGSIGGFLIGADALAGENVRLGVIGGYSRSTFRAGARNSSGTSDNYDAGIYAGGQWGNFGLRAGAAYTWHAVRMDRSVAFAGFSDALSSKYDAGSAQAFGELGYTVTTGKSSFEPFASVAYVDLSTNAFAEKGGAAALTGKKADMGVAFTTLGAHAKTSFSLGNGNSVTARGTVGWRHAFDNSTSTVVALAGSSAFDIGGVPIARDVASVDLGLDMDVGKNTTLGLTYGGQFGSGATDQSVRATVSFRF